MKDVAYFQAAQKDRPVYQTFERHPFSGGLTLEAFNLKISKILRTVKKNQYLGCREKFLRTEHDMIIK